MSLYLTSSTSHRSRASRSLQRCLGVKTDEVVFRRGAGIGRVECLLMIFQEDGSGRGDASPRGKEGIAQDAEDPPFEVGVRAKRVEGAKCFGEGFLYQVLSLRLIASEPARVIVERWQKRERKLFELCAASGGHFLVRCFAPAGVTEMDGHAEQSFSSEHHYLNRIVGRLFPGLFCEGPGINAAKTSFLLQR
jgi:hypothetical protein